MADEMLINGLIKFCDAKSKNMELKAEPQVYVEIKCALEELSAIKTDGFTDHLLNMGYTKGYRKGIDEFAEVLKKELSNYDFWKYDIVTDLGVMQKGVTRDYFIDEIAEQLKAGGKE